MPNSAEEGVWLFSSPFFLMPAETSESRCQHDASGDIL